MQNAEKFYATLMVGAAFDRAAFERRIEAMGRVRNFGDFQQAKTALQKENRYPVEVAVIATGDEDQYYTWFSEPIPWWVMLVAASGSDRSFKDAAHVFSVGNEKIIEKSAWKMGRGWVVLDTMRPAENARQSARMPQESEEDVQRMAEAFYATLQIGAPFDQADFERQVAAMGGTMAHFQPAEYTRRSFNTKYLAESGARLHVDAVGERNNARYHTVFYTQTSRDGILRRAIPPLFSYTERDNRWKIRPERRSMGCGPLKKRKTLSAARRIESPAGRDWKRKMSKWYSLLHC
ncbi:MAG: hypothetical protein LBU11_07725 [Zoogloeaceae bacterium]|jgi:hypothetical protein|nr:hypothetical protein [Zoogloeaceae bacterium]